MSGPRDIALPPVLQAAKAATRALISAFGGQEAAEAETGRAQSRFSAYGGRNTPDYIPLDLVDALEDLTFGLPGWPHITRWLCRRRGGVFVRLPDAVPGPKDLQCELGAVSKETGDVLVSLGEGLRDNSLDAAERAASRGEIAEAIERLVLLDMMLARGGD